MAILTLETTNENISWVIYKNPMTQEQSGVPFEKPLRKGMIYGWYVEPTQFRVFFDQENGDPSFYKNESNNYLNADKVLCSYAYCGMIGNMLDATMKKLHEKDIVCQNKITLNTVWIPNAHIARSFQKHFSSIVIEMEPLGSKLFNIVFSGDTTIHYLLNVVNVFCLMQALEDRRVFVDLTEATIDKYAQCLNLIDAPYYIRYIFLSRCVPDYNVFKKVSVALAKEGWTFFYGDTQKQRFNAIKKVLRNGGNNLHDIGCGELYYSVPLSQNYKEIIAWDSDDYLMERNKLYLKKKNVNNVILKNRFSIEDFIHLEKDSDILITEMLEHIELEEANEILNGLSSIKFSKLVITLPNTSFNKYYLLDGQYRHYDHKWEPTYEESVELISNNFKNHEIQIEKIGDMVEGESVSTMFVIKGK
jgi:hypothetical protein